MLPIHPETGNKEIFLYTALKRKFRRRHIKTAVFLFNLPNGYFALGFGGNGITLSLIAAEILKDIITGKKNPDHEIYFLSAGFKQKNKNKTASRKI